MKDKQRDEIVQGILTYIKSVRESFNSPLLERIIMDKYRIYLVGYANGLINQGYQKVDENSIVITKTEYEKLIEQRRKARSEMKRFKRKYLYLKEEYESLNNGSKLIDVIRKETAEKIFKEIKSKGQFEYFTYDDDKYCVSSDAIEKLAKQFGGEV